VRAVPRTGYYHDRPKCDKANRAGRGNWGGPVASEPV